MDVKEMREALKMSRPQFSEWSGIPVRTLENWESGSRVPPSYVVDLLNVKFKEVKRMRERLIDLIGSCVRAWDSGLYAYLRWDVEDDSVWYDEYVSENDWTDYKSSSVTTIPLADFRDRIIYKRGGLVNYVAPEDLVDDVLAYMDKVKKSL